MKLVTIFLLICAIYVVHSFSFKEQLSKINKEKILESLKRFQKAGDKVISELVAPFSKVIKEFVPKLAPDAFKMFSKSCNIKFNPGVDMPDGLEKFTDSPIYAELLYCMMRKAGLVLGDEFKHTTLRFYLAALAPSVDPTEVLNKCASKENAKKENFHNFVKCMKGFNLKYTFFD